MRKLIMGCDEAGRGSVVGPMVLAGLAFDERTLKKVAKLGVRDSKTLTPRSRERLYSIIKDLAEEFCVIKLKPRLIDSYVVDVEGTGKNLNILEARTIARMINRVRPSIVYVDCPDPKTERFAEMIKGAVSSHVRIICEHKADSRRIVVAASSVVAKVTRDREVAKLRKNWGDFGSGYPSDIKTRRFLYELTLLGGRPDIVRWSWKTLGKITTSSSNKNHFVKQ